MKLMQVYNVMPVFTQNIACSVKGLTIRKNRYGKTFFRLLEKYESRNNWSYDRLCEYRDKRLQRLLKHCYLTVPYYKKLFDEYGINYEHIRHLDELNCIPVLDKQTVLEHYNDFISTAMPSSQMVKAHTSGTTGGGFIFYTTHHTLSEQWAVWWRYRKNLGLTFDTWCALFGGQSIVPPNRRRPPYSRMNVPCRQEYFSNYHMNSENLKWYLDEIRSKKYTWIHGYPSAINLLADYALEHDVPPMKSLKFITTGAENLLPAQREKIRKAFGIDPRNHYGMAEGVANFSETKDGDMYVDEDYAAVEFLDLPGQNGKEIIGTSLTNFAMPLIRYRTKDTAECQITAEGRKILSLDGRQEDYVVLPDGSKIGRLDHIFKDMIHVREAQIRQKNRQSAELYVVKDQAYSQKDEERLLYEAKSRLPGLEIKVTYIERIPRTSNGKLRFVISEI